MSLQVHGVPVRHFADLRLAADAGRHVRGHVVRVVRRAGRNQDLFAELPRLRRRTEPARWPDRGPDDGPAGRADGPDSHQDAAAPRRHVRHPLRRRGLAGAVRLRVHRAHTARA